MTELSKKEQIQAALKDYDKVCDPDWKEYYKVCAADLKKFEKKVEEIENGIKQ